MQGHTIKTCLFLQQILYTPYRRLPTKAILKLQHPLPAKILRIPSVSPLPFFNIISKSLLCLWVFACYANILNYPWMSFQFGKGENIRWTNSLNLNSHSLVHFSEIRPISPLLRGNFCLQNVLETEDIQCTTSPAPTTLILLHSIRSSNVSESL